MLRYRICADRTHGYLSNQAENLGLDTASVPSFAEICKELFSDIRTRRTSKLILDIRGNGGGDSTVAMGSLYRYLFDGDIRTYGVDMRITPTLQDAVDWAKGMPLGDHHYDSNTIPYPFDSIPGFFTMPEAKFDWGAVEQFKGNVIVLIDNDTFSSGEWLAVDLYDNGLGTFIGEPTGCGGSVPGEIVNFYIPEVDATLYTCCRFFRRPGADRGSVKPHIYVRPTVDDFRRKHDVVMERALTL